MKKIALLLVVLACLSIGAVADHFSLPFGGYQIAFDLNSSGGNWTEIGIGDLLSIGNFSSQHLGLKKLSRGVVDIYLYRYAEPQKSDLAINGQISGYLANTSSQEFDAGNEVHSAMFWIDEFNRIELRTTFKESISKELIESLSIQ